MSNHTFQTWSYDDQDMEVRHHRHWQRFIDLIEESTLEGREVLDFGCNQGGFLRALYERLPFSAALGVDIVEQSLAVAESRKGDLPISYELTTSPERHSNRFDLACSNAVVYLIEDMAHHAEVVKTMLKPGGVYYATHSEYQPGPELDAMRTKINGYSPMKMQDHSLTDITRAFSSAGFTVGVQLFRADGFVAVDLQQPGAPEVADRLRRAAAQKHIFRMQAPL